MEWIFLVILLQCLLAQGYEIDHLPERRIHKRDTDYPIGIDYVGIGYNLLYGNPDGSPTTAALDPGLRSTWRIFDWTFYDGESTPDQIIYTPAISCADIKDTELYHNEYSYSEKFDLDVELSGSSTFGFGSVKFSHSSYYGEASSSFGASSYVYYEEVDYCNMGEARLMTELAQPDQYPLTRSFVHSVNSLPVTYTEYDDDYMQFIEDFGTHVVIKVILGTKEVDRYYWTTSEFTSYSSEYYSSATSLGGSYLGYSGSIEVDTDSVEESFDSETSTASHSEKFTLGDEDLSLPYGYTLMSIDEIFENKYWTLHDDYVADGILSADFYDNLTVMRNNIYQALEDYADWLNSVDAIEDNIVAVPITWPRGTYGLPKPSSGCPMTSGFAFHEGNRKHDTEDDDNANDVSDPNHFVSESVTGNIIQYFCMKTDEEVTDWDVNWPNGRYCIFQSSSGECPTGMEEGKIYWDDEDDDNRNSYEGSVPFGDYGSNTRIYYCCMVDGFAENAIYLPTDSSFYLFPRDNKCQEVEGMDSTMENIKWDNEDDDNNSAADGEYPYKTDSGNHRIHYCYYSPTPVTKSIVWGGWPGK